MAATNAKSEKNQFSILVDKTFAQIGMAFSTRVRLTHLVETVKRVTFVGVKLGLSV
jgi:hypothetical protein